MSSEGLRVRDVMASSTVTVDPNDRLLQADQVTRLHRIRHLPVVDEEGALVGVLSQRDLFHSGLLKALGYGQHGQEKLLDTFLVKEIMVTEVVTVGPDTPVRDAARLMIDRKIGCLPVMEGDRLVGIVTETDFVSLVAEGS